MQRPASHSRISSLRVVVRVSVSACPRVRVSVCSRVRASVCVCVCVRAVVLARLNSSLLEVWRSAPWAVAFIRALLSQASAFE
eukprot:106527-Alexandrium_andersonii.AAC.1